MEELRVEIKRRPDEVEYCTACEEQDELCTSHCRESPIPVFQRIRFILFIPSPCGRYYQVICSCLFHGCFGCPCPHVACLLLKIKPHHIILKHHTKVQAGFGRNGKEEITAEFNKRKNDYRLCVTKQEKDKMIAAAKGLAATYEKILGPEFWSDVGPRYCTRTGLIARDNRIKLKKSGYLDHAEGLMSQEVFLTREIGGGESDNSDNKKDDSNGASEQPTDMRDILQTDNLYDMLKSTMNIVADRNRLLGDPRIEGGIRLRCADLLSWVNEQTIQNKATRRDFSGYIVSSHIPIDKRQRAVRLKRKAEGKTKSGRSQVKKKARLTAGSFMEYVKETNSRASILYGNSSAHSISCNECNGSSLLALYKRKRISQSPGLGTMGEMEGALVWGICVGKVEGGAWGMSVAVYGPSDGSRGPVSVMKAAPADLKMLGAPTRISS